MSKATWQVFSLVEFLLTVTPELLQAMCHDGRLASTVRCLRMCGVHAPQLLLYPTSVAAAQSDALCALGKEERLATTLHVLICQPTPHGFPLRHGWRCEVLEQLCNAVAPYRLLRHRPLLLRAASSPTFARLHDHLQSLVTQKIVPDSLPSDLSY